MFDFLSRNQVLFSEVLQAGSSSCVHNLFCKLGCRMAPAVHNLCQAVMSQAFTRHKVQLTRLSSADVVSAFSSLCLSPGFVGLADCLGHRPVITINLSIYPLRVRQALCLQAVHPNDSSEASVHSCAGPRVYSFVRQIQPSKYREETAVQLRQQGD